MAVAPAVVVGGKQEIGDPVHQHADQHPRCHHFGEGDGQCLLDETGHGDHRDGHDEQYGWGTFACHRLLHQEIEQQCDQQHSRQGIVGQQGHQPYPTGHDPQQEGCACQPLLQANRFSGLAQHQPGHD
ncbi:hypothetical protein [Aeromonas veronii]|uniref:hypothetical protein n=1 Tax=Aeromonas veronii TaxID=654 RepID=UPI003DA5FB10